MIAARGGKLVRGTGFGVVEDGDPAYTITATHPHAVCAGFGYKASPGAGSIGYRDEQAPTLLAGRCDASVLCMADDNARCAIDSDLCGTLKVAGGGADDSCAVGWVPETVESLCAADGKGVGNRLVSSGKVIAQ